MCTAPYVATAATIVNAKSVLIKLDGGVLFTSRQIL
jgi:hypothetical protein